MQSTFYIQMPIAKTYEVTQRALEEVITVCLASRKFEHAICASENGLYTIAINADDRFPNIKQMLLNIAISTRTDPCATLLKTRLTYDLKNTAFHRRLYNRFVVRRLIKKMVDRHFADFKKRVEKWL